MTVRDALWLFASKAHDDDVWLGKNRDGTFFSRSRITPAEGALMLDVPNMILVSSGGIPVPFSEDAYGYAESFNRMQKVLWSVTGSGGFRIGNEEKFICELAEKYPNTFGGFADDFLYADFGKENDDRMETLASIRRELDKACRKMELWATIYTHNLPDERNNALAMFDALTIWTWSYEEIANLPKNFASIEEKFPKHDKYLGVYILDYPSGRPVPNEFMEQQCEFALEMLKQGRVKGIIFLTNCVMGVKLSSEYWLREWIDKVKSIEL